MRSRLFVLGTFDQPVEALYGVDLMQCLAEAGVPPSGVIFKRSAASSNPAAPVQAAADVHGRVTLHVHDFNAPDVVAAIRALDADLLVYAGGRDLLRRPLLDAARLGCLGGHYGRLPAVRGMGTPEWSVIVGEAPAVAIQRIDAGIDTGDVVMQARVPLLPQDNFTSVRDRSYYMTKVMLALAARRYLVDGIAPVPQRREDGRQYYRLHPALQARADRALRSRLSS